MLRFADWVAMRVASVGSFSTFSMYRRASMAGDVLRGGGQIEVLGGFIWVSISIITYGRGFFFGVGLPAGYFVQQKRDGWMDGGMDGGGRVERGWDGPYR